MQVAMKIQREFISARVVQALRRSLYYFTYTIVPKAK